LALPQKIQIKILTRGLVEIGKQWLHLHKKILLIKEDFEEANLNSNLDHAANLMRLRIRREKLKAAPAPKMGRGLGTPEVD